MSKKNGKKISKKYKKAKKQQISNIEQWKQEDIQSRKKWEEEYNKLWDFIKSIQFNEQFLTNKKDYTYQDIIGTSNHIARDIIESEYDFVSLDYFTEQLLDKIDNKFDNDICFLIDKVADFPLFDSKDSVILEKLKSEISEETYNETVEFATKFYGGISDESDNYVCLILYTAAAHIIRYDFHYIENYLDEMKEELIDERKEARFNWQIYKKSVI